VAPKKFLICFTISALVSIPWAAFSAPLSAAPREAAISYGKWGFDLSGMDRSVRPGENFAEYATGNATKRIVIPGDRGGYGSFDKLSELSERRIRAIVEDRSSAFSQSADGERIRSLYESFMDLRARNALDIRPLLPKLARIQSIKDRSELARYMGETSFGFGASIFALSVTDDAKAPERYVLQLGQAGLSLPDRDYYLTPAFSSQLEAYRAYVTQLFRMTGYPHPEESAGKVVDFEIRIAKASWTSTEQRDRIKSYNPMNLAALPSFAPGFDWPAFFSGSATDKAAKVVVVENTAVARIADIYRQEPLETLKAWEVFQTVDQAAIYLSSRFNDAYFNFHQKLLMGLQADSPPWSKAVGVVHRQLGDALGRAYVSSYVPASTKPQVEAIVADLLAAMKARITNVTWMTDQTKAEALAKLARFRVKVAFPDHWQDYSGLYVSPSDLFGNLERTNALEWKRQVSRIDGQIAPDDWLTKPYLVNAFFSATRNEIIFPAAILQPPFFDPNADAAVNYGAIGSVIGHEITHAFDDQGRHYDRNGILREWWTPADAKEFDRRAENLVLQYDRLSLSPGVTVNGKLTLGENIADLGGVLVALDAYHLHLKHQDAPVLDGLSGDQRFFLAWAQVWESKYTPELEKRLATTDLHSPDRFRASQTVRNVDGWYEAFGITKDDKAFIAPTDRTRIW